MKLSLTAMALGLAVMSSTFLLLQPAEARQGADDPAGHIRQSRGADDGTMHRRRCRGCEDAPGHIRGGGDDNSPDDSGRGRGRGRGGNDGGKGRGGRDDGPHHA